MSKINLKKINLKKINLVFILNNTPFSEVGDNLTSEKQMEILKYVTESNCKNCDILLAYHKKCDSCSIYKCFTLENNVCLECYKNDKFDIKVSEYYNVYGIFIEKYGSYRKLDIDIGLHKNISYDEVIVLFDKHGIKY